MSSKLTRVQMQFASGLALLGAPEAIEQHVTLTPMDDGQTHVEFQDRLTRVEGKK